MSKTANVPLVLVIALCCLALSATAVPAEEASSAPRFMAQEGFSADSLSLAGIMSREDFVWLSAAPAGCHSTTPCGAAYPSCGSWSGYSNCGDPVCSVRAGCGGDCGPGPGLCLGPALRQFLEQFRVCFNAAGQSCTEYQQATQALHCGC